MSYIENDASLCADMQLRQVIKDYLNSNPRYMDELNMNASRKKEL